ncbi:MAG: hypothetical protein JWP01_1427 [Myxococcales bacterium]|nr:hypothetical protein [Myxococcales bacterium]
MKSMLLAATVILAGCEVMYEPDVGRPQASLDEVDAGIDPDGGSDAGPTPTPISKCVDSDPTVTVSFSRDIRALTNRSPGGCLSCHGTSTTSGFSLGSYESMRRGGANSGVRIIVAGKPCESILVQKLGLAPPFGARMPYNGPPYYTATELTLVRDWIAEGARNN